MTPNVISRSGAGPGASFIFCICHLPEKAFIHAHCSFCSHYTILRSGFLCLNCLSRWSSRHRGGIAASPPRHPIMASPHRQQVRMPILPLLPRSFHYAPFWIPFRLCLSVRGSVLGCRAVVTWRVACQAALWAAARLSGGACLGSPNGQFLERGPAF